jgi:hypothetical protein
VEGVRALEPTCTEDRGLAWSGVTWRTWERCLSTRLNAKDEENEQDRAIADVCTGAGRGTKMMVDVGVFGARGTHPVPSRTGS